MKSARILLLMSVVCALCPAHADERLRANYFYQQADSMAQIHFNAPYDLVVLRSDTIDQTGTSACWKAIFQNEEKTLIFYFQNGHLSTAVHPCCLLGNAVIGSSGWIDSDSALAIAEKNGGERFRSHFPRYTISAELGGESGYPVIEWRIIYQSLLFSGTRLTVSVKAYTGDIYYQWEPKPVSYFPLRVGDQWSYYSTETGSSKEPIEFNEVSDSVLIQDRTYFRYNGSYFRSDSFGHVYRYHENGDILWFDFTKAEGESYEVDFGGCHFKVTMTSRHATVHNWAGKFTDCLSLYFDDPTLFDDQFEYVFAENMGIVRQNLAHAIWLELYEATIHGAHYPDLRNYFPLEFGNYWLYREEGMDDLARVRILDTLTVDGNLCAYYGSNRGTADMIFADGLGRIWQYKNNRPVLWFDFTTADADSYFYRPDSTLLNYTVKVHKHKTITTKFGVLEECVTFIFDDPHAVDEEKSYTFAPNLGIVDIWSGMGIHHVLESACIHDKLITGISSNKTAFPQKVSLEQNYPNPFNPSTTIAYEIATAGEVEFNLYNMLGQRIRTFKVFTTPGVHRFDLSAKNLSSGVYLYEIKSGQCAERKKLVVQK